MTGAFLQPGDVLLYYLEHDFVDTIIAEKTGKPVGHIEVYVGNEQSYASRNGVGVDIYSLRLDGLICVRRLIQPIALDQGANWFQSVAKGQPYDFKGLLTFTSFIKHGEAGKMFCSEFALNFYRACAFEPFNKDQLAENTSPRDFWMCGAFNTVWKSDENY